NSLGTFFACTSTSTSSERVGVELFDSTGSLLNDAATTAVTLSSGAAVIFATAGATGISVNQSFTPPTMQRGSARVISTSQSLVCTAFVADALNDPPVTSWQLTIIAKTKQKAAN